MPDLDLVFDNCNVVTTSGVFFGWVGVEDGRIVAMGRADRPAAARVIDGGGQHLLPGRIEPHCHLRAQTFTEELVDSSQQAVAGGVTTLMPYMRATESYLDQVPEWSSAVTERSYADVLFHLQIQIPEHIAEIPLYRKRFGVKSYKVHIDSRHPISGFGLRPVDDGDVYLTMLAVREFDGLVAVHCENTEINRRLLDQIRGSGMTGLNAWANVRPPVAEASDVSNVVYLAAQLGCRVLIVHVSSQKSVDAALLHRHPGTLIETLAHQLAITASDAEARIGAAGKMIPPLRGQDERDGLWTAISDGRITFVGSDDHVPDYAKLDAERSSSVEFWSAESASPGIGLALPIMLTEGMRRGIDIATLVRLMSEAPAKAFGIDAEKGSISIGKQADLVLVDLETERTVEAGSLASRGITVADGVALRGWPTVTCLRGRVVFEDGELQEANDARVISPGG